MAADQGCPRVVPPGAGEVGLRAEFQAESLALIAVMEEAMCSRGRFCIFVLLVVSVGDGLKRGVSALSTGLLLFVFFFCASSTAGIAL